MNYIPSEWVLEFFGYIYDFVIVPIRFLFARKCLKGEWHWKWDHICDHQECGAIKFWVDGKWIN